MPYSKKKVTDFPLALLIGLVFLLMLGAVSDSPWSPFPEPTTPQATPPTVGEPVPYQPIGPQVVIEKRDPRQPTSERVRYAPIPKSLTVRKQKIVQQRETARERAKTRSRPDRPSRPSPKPSPEPSPEPSPGDDGSLVTVCVTDICIEASGLGASGGVR